MTDELKRVCRAFRIEGEWASYEEISVGNINHTYKVNFIRPDGQPKSYIVQRVNTYVYKNPIEVMENIDRVTEHIRAKKPGQTALHFHHTIDRKTYYVDTDGFWRLFNYIPSDSCVEMDLDAIHNAGEAFGEFQMQLSDFDPAQLYETIVNFHNTPWRYEKLERDVKEDLLGRVAEVGEELEYLRSIRDKACVLTELYRQGKLPLRVTHNDTKINNVLFDQETRRALVVIDLDTVMPGVVGHDFGDAIRFAANVVEEDCPQPEKAGVDLEVFRAFADGFLKNTASALTQTEIDTLAQSCLALTAELSVRFLDDYIQGDPYFKINYPAHNLVRSRCQMALPRTWSERWTPWTPSSVNARQNIAEEKNRPPYRSSERYGGRLRVPEPGKSAPGGD